MDKDRVDQCVLCLFWFPINEMIGDEDGHEFVCWDCAPSYTAWW
jgi:hypothetical protein